MSNMQSPRILILDDDDHYALLFSTYLKLGGVEGGEVEHATSAKSGVERLRALCAGSGVSRQRAFLPIRTLRPGLKALRDAGYEGPVVVQSACAADEVFDEAPRLGVA